MSQETQSGVSGGDAVAAKAVTFSYDNLGEFLTIARYADLAKTEQVAQSTYGYDLDGNLTSLTYANANSTLPSYAWTYDPLGNMA
jgi:YD repeat-containing protein